MAGFAEETSTTRSGDSCSSTPTLPGLYGDESFTGSGFVPLVVFAGTADESCTTRSGDSCSSTPTLPGLYGDESFTGPDGDIIEVFYPAVGAPEHPTEDCFNRGAFDMGGHKSTFDVWESAEAGVGDVVAFMQRSAASRHEARSRLFDTVQAAAAVALGEHFEHFALIGSAALCIDTPESDLDAVAFTRYAAGIASNGSANELNARPPPDPVEALHWVKHALSCHPSLQLQLVECTQVPLLTVIADDGEQLDLTVDQPLGVWHVQWFQSQRVVPFAPLNRVPAPRGSWERGLESLTLQCVKLWIRRRGIPVAKHGGYPTVVWNLMVLHVLRCSVFVDGGNTVESTDERTLLGAVAAFFDRFADGGLVGTLLFAGGTHAEFRPQVESKGTQMLSPGLSVLDPTAVGGETPTNLAPRVSPATQLLHTYELQRGQQLSAEALASCRDREYQRIREEGKSGAAAVRALFASVSEVWNTVPTVVPAWPCGVLVLRDDRFQIGLLRRIDPKPGWGANFLHRRDASSRILIRWCDIDETTGTVVQRDGGRRSLSCVHPCDVVCIVPLHNRGSDDGAATSSALEMGPEGVERWRCMKALLRARAGDCQPTDKVESGRRQTKMSRWRTKGRSTRSGLQGQLT